MTIQLNKARKTIAQLDAVSRQIQKEWGKRLATADLTSSQALAIQILAEHAPLSLKALGEALPTDTPPSRLVSGLVAKRMVSRVEDSDRRQVVLTLTRKGKKALTTIKRCDTALARWVAKRLPQSAAKGVASAHRMLVTI
jgi:DNA-binding MarR family transcriptional regulator